MSLYGYSRATTPFLERLAQRAVVFDNVYVQLPGTLPSHMSVMTSLYPDQHGVMPPDGVLSEQITTIPELFSQHGYRTAGLTEGGYVSGRFGFSRGFDRFDDSFNDLWHQEPNVFGAGLDFIEGLGEDESFFLFLHTYAVHAPYTPPEECRDLFWHGEVPSVDPPLGPNLREHNLGIAVIDQSTAEYYAALYDAEVRCLDMRLEAFFDDLERLGVADEVTVILMSDHGEEFLDHGKMVHNQIYMENTHVPLILVTPGISEGRRVPAIVQSIDIAPTLYDIAGIEAPPWIAGQTTVPLVSGAQDRLRDFAVSQSISGDRGLVASTKDGLYHLLSMQPGFEPADGQVGVASLLRLRVPRGGLDFEARAFRQPVRMNLRLDGIDSGEVALGPKDWTRVQADVPPGTGTAVLRLAADSCQPISQNVEQGGGRCRSLIVRGLPIRRHELYALGADRLETIDLSMDRPDLTADLAGRLADLHWQAVSLHESAPIDEELEDQLRALGYLE